jgi:oligopeptidase A
VLDATNAFELLVDDETRLAGLPDSARAAARQNAESKGKRGFRFTLQAPSYIAVMKHLDDGSLRETMYRALSTRGTSGEYDNRPLLDDIVALRNEKAKLLGFDHFADFATEERMAKSGAQALGFVRGLEEKTRSAFGHENDALRSFCEEHIDDQTELAPWDVAYYAEKLRQAQYSFDDEVLRPYFQFEQVLAGLFDIAGRLYGVRFEAWQDAPAWHETVRGYKVIDENGDWIAGIYIDAFPRESKRGGAWMNGLLTRHQAMPEPWPHLGLLAANVTPAVGDDDAQLTHREVETMFHEFGHLMHHCLSRVALRSQAGTEVAWDFVELPSQIFENWCWEREALDLFAHHADSGETIPDTLLDAMRRARTFRAANGQMRQLGFATVDLGLHTDFDSVRDGSLVKHARDVLQAYSPCVLPDDYAMIAAFDHLFGDPVGYAAAYYSYKWAEVLDADAFTLFKTKGIFNAEVGRSFRDEILARGDEEDPAVLFRNFMGRDPDQAPLLARLGLDG